VQRAADRLRVSAQLIDTASGTQVWAERFDRELIDVFSIQDDIARRITDALTQRITEVRPVGERVPPTQNVEAYLAYLRGRDLVARWTIADAAAAEAAFERAIELDSGFAAAYAALYDARMMAAERRTGGGSVGPARPRAWATAGDLAPARERNHILVDKALALDPQSAVAYYARAIWADDRDRSRESDFRRAMTLDPSYGRGITSFAEWLDRQGRGDEAEAMLERAIRIDPLSPRAHFWRVMRTWEARQSAGTLETDMLRVLEVDPDYQPALQRYAKYRWMNHGATAEAIQLIEHAIALDPTNPWSLHTAIAMYLDIGELDTARRLRGRSERPDLSGDVLIKLYEGDVLAAGEAALTDAAFAHGFAEIWRVYDALSDWARATGDYARAIDYIETRVQLTAVTTEFTLANYWAVPALADMLMLTGEDARARALLERCIDWLDRDFLSRLPPVYAVRIKADALLLLGERERALETLRAAFAAADYQQWWYTLERDPNWRALAEDPAFRALAADVHRHVERERSLLAALRAQGLVPAAAPVDTASGH
jgi:tetratricopeptide (TPR) repeat protein